APARRNLWRPLNNGDFRLLMGSNTLWWMTLFMENLVVGWLVLEMTNSPWMVALIGCFRSLPLLLCGVWGGAASERFGRRKVIVAAQATNFLVYLFFWSMLLGGRLQFWHLAAGSFLLGCGWSLDWPARRALVPDLVGKQQTL